MKTISSAFVKAKKAFGPALKDKTNPAFRSKYADLGACIDAVEEALLTNGIALIQETFDDPTGVTVETVFLHESGESLRCGKLHVPASKQDPQGYGSALTYARRYSLCAACGIAPEDDDGNAASKPANRTPEPAKRQDDATSPAAVAKRLTAQATDNIEAVAAVMAGWEREEVKKVWPFIPKDTQQAITLAINKMKETA
jgi:hypothetical protein